eukprot:401112_1
MIKSSALLMCIIGVFSMEPQRSPESSKRLSGSSPLLSAELPQLSESNINEDQPQHAIETASIPPSTKASRPLIGFGKTLWCGRGSRGRRSYISWPSNSATASREFPREQN